MSTPWGIWGSNPGGGGGELPKEGLNTRKGFGPGSGTGEGALVLPRKWTGPI